MIDFSNPERRKYIRNAFSFEDLISGPEASHITDHLRICNPEYILDVGCGVGTALLGLYYDLGPRWLQGLDRETKNTVVRWKVEELEKNGFHVDSHDHHKILAASITPDDRSVMPEIQDYKNFDSILRLSFYNDPVSWSEKYDLFIFSNVIHYMKADEIHRWNHIMRTASSKNCLIYIRIKDQFKDAPIKDNRILISMCQDIAQQFGLEEYKSAEETHEGWAWTWTNL